MNKVLIKIGQIGFLIAMFEYVIVLMLEICFTKTIRAIQKYVLNDKTEIRSCSYFLFKFSAFIGMKLNGIEFVITKPVSLPGQL